MENASIPTNGRNKCVSTQWLKCRCFIHQSLIDARIMAADKQICLAGQFQAEPLTNRIAYSLTYALPHPLILSVRCREAIYIIACIWGVAS